MKPLVLAAIITSTSMLPLSAMAADLEGPPVEGVIIDDADEVDGPVVVERERVIERHYYPEPAYVDDVPSVVVHERAYRPPYYPERRYWRVHGDW